MLLVLSVMLVAVGLTSCDDNSSSFDQNGQESEYQRIFEGMKGNYVGSWMTPLNFQKQVKYTIDSQANVNIPNFPMDAVLNKLIGGDYQYANLSGEALSVSCPIDSVGYSSGYMTFVTKKDYNHNKLNFSYTYLEKQHEGLMYFTVKGVYDPLRKIINTNVIVTDLVIDQQDLTSKLCPIDNVFEAAQQ